MSDLGWGAEGSAVLLWERTSRLRTTAFSDTILLDLVIVCKQVWNMNKHRH